MTTVVKTYKKVKSDGYILLKIPTHPNAAKQNGYIRENRFVMSEHLGHPLTKDEIVHHINGIRNDNRIENLIILTRRQHISTHKKNYSQSTSKNPHKIVNNGKEKWCPGCKKLLPFASFCKDSQSVHNLHPICRKCKSIRVRTIPLVCDFCKIKYKGLPRSRFQKTHFCSQECHKRFRKIKH